MRWDDAYFSLDKTVMFRKDKDSDIIFEGEVIEVCNKSISIKVHGTDEIYKTTAGKIWFKKRELVRTYNLDELGNDLSLEEKIIMLALYIGRGNRFPGKDTDEPDNESWRIGDSSILESLEEKEYIKAQSKWKAYISDKGLDMGQILYERADKNF